MVIKIDFEKKENQLPPNKLNLGTGLKQMLKHLKEKEESDNSLNPQSFIEAEKTFREDCKKSVIEILKKLKERSPLKYPLVRSAVCLNPQYLVDHKETATHHMRVLSEKLAAHNVLTPKETDTAKTEHDKFI